MERRAYRISGFLMLGLGIVLGVIVAGAADQMRKLPESTSKPYFTGLIVVAGLLYAAIVSGFVVVNPNEARVIQFFGRYVGSLRDAGFHWTVPFSTKRRLSLRVRNFESARLKVSDADGNPVEIAAVVVWRVVDSAKAMFAVDDHVAYVAVQAEAAVRHLATSYPYEAHESDRVSLREATQVSEELTVELRERGALAGVEVLGSKSASPV